MFSELFTFEHHHLDYVNNWDMGESHSQGIVDNITIDLTSMNNKWSMD